MLVPAFTHSPVGTLEPNGARVVWDLINIFRVHDEGRLVVLPSCRRWRGWPRSIARLCSTA
jgi:hypothetical protein